MFRPPPRPQPPNPSPVGGLGPLCLAGGRIMSFTASILSSGKRHSSCRYPPAARSAIWNCDSFGFLPNCTLRACARLRPSAVRARIIDRSNSANAPRTAIMSFPCAVVVSIIASARERKPAPLSLIVAGTFSKSLVLRASRSSSSHLVP